MCVSLSHTHMSAARSFNEEFTFDVPAKIDQDTTRIVFTVKNSKEASWFDCLVFVCYLPLVTVRFDYARGGGGRGSWVWVPRVP